MKLARKIAQIVPKSVRSVLRRMWWPLLVRVPRLGALYYLFDGSFVREFRAVLAGLRAYSRDDRSRLVALRRNTHRLEKGLIMRPLKPAFAAKYIGETVDLYHGLASGPSVSDEARRLLGEWSGDVLARYFQTVAPGQDKAIDRSRAKFQAASPGGAGAAQHSPYKRRLADPPPVDYESLLALAQRRRSVRWYLPKPVPRELIDKAIAVGGLSPSACNRQPFEFRVYDDPEAVAEIASVPGGAAGFYRGFPCVIVLTGDLGAFMWERDRHVIYIDAALAAMAFQFALEAQGLSSCCINWPDLLEKEKAMAERITLRPEERVIMLLSVGYPDPEGQVPYSQKKSLDELRSYNRQ